MAEGKKTVLQQVKFKDVTIEKMSGSFPDDNGVMIPYEKFTLIIDDLEFDFNMDKSVKKLFSKLIKFEDVTEA